MMGKQNGQIQIAILDIDSMIPEDHLLRQIKDEVLTKFFRIPARKYGTGAYLFQGTYRLYFVSEKGHGIVN